ncbi:hypothetical protein B0O99DRAFT_674115 [Bisporella sp. PMI_857]|nr:hypothetical protein B0O99DRAFT_674115 [Bisporella sp. PMI_857]
MTRSISPQVTCLEQVKQEPGSSITVPVDLLGSLVDSIKHLCDQVKGLDHRLSIMQSDHPSVLASDPSSGRLATFGYFHKLPPELRIWETAFDEPQVVGVRFTAVCGSHGGTWSCRDTHIIPTTPRSPLFDEITCLALHEQEFFDNLSSDFLEKIQYLFPRLTKLFLIVGSEAMFIKGSIKLKEPTRRPWTYNLRSSQGQHWGHLTKTTGWPMMKEMAEERIDMIFEEREELRDDVGIDLDDESHPLNYEEGYCSLFICAGGLEVEYREIAVDEGSA